MKIITKILLFHGIFLIFSINALFSQVGINPTGAPPASSAMLDVVSTNKGILIPRMTLSQRSGIGSPAPGLLVYQTDSVAGFYYYNGGAWEHIGNANGSSGNVIDIDGNVYPTVKIGNQIWTAENLRVTHYRNGDTIPEVTGNSQWTGLDSGAFCWYEDSIKYQVPYGALYNWYVVGDSRKICPYGWHAPSHAEYIALKNYLGGWTLAGGRMKATRLWNSPNTGAANTYGFSCYPSGYRSGDDGTFNNLGIAGSGWSSLDNGAYGYGFNPVNYSAELFHGDVGKTYGMSVRCVRDF